MDNTAFSTLFGGPRFGEGTYAGLLLGNEGSGCVFDGRDDQFLIRDNTGSVPRWLGNIQQTIDAGILSFSRASTALFVGSNGLIQTAASGAWRRVYDPVTLLPLGYLSEPAATNLALWSNDFTNVAWVKTTMTAAMTATGPDGVSNSASTLTATAGNAVALQTIVSGSALRITSCYIKRRTGTGVINLTQNNGGTWTAVTVTSAWAQVAIPAATAANPIIGIQIVTNGDAVDVAYFQHELCPYAYATSPILTTSASATRAGDVMILDLTKVPFSQTGDSVAIRRYSPLAQAATNQEGWAISNHTAVSFNDTMASPLTNTLTNRANLTTRWGGGSGTTSKGSLNQTGLIKQAASFVVGQPGRLAVDGSSTVSGATTILAPTAVQDRMGIGIDWGLVATNNAAGAPIDAIVIVPRGWTDAELLARTLM